MSLKSMVCEHAHEIVKGSFTILQEEIMVKVEVHMVPPVVIDPCITLIVVDIMVIMPP